MKLLIFVGLIAFAAALPAARPPPPQTNNDVEEDDPKTVKILVSEYDQNPEDGSYTFRFELSDGQKRSEQGVVVTVTKKGKEIRILKVTGESEYVNSDGKIEHINYGADQYGSTFEGDSIPEGTGGGDVAGRSIEAEGAEIESDNEGEENVEEDE